MKQSTNTNTTVISTPVDKRKLYVHIQFQGKADHQLEVTASNHDSGLDVKLLKAPALAYETVSIVIDPKEIDPRGRGGDLRIHIESKTPHTTVMTYVPVQFS